MITVVDYGMGNLGSMINMFKRLGVTARCAASAEELRDATKIILPGVGAFDAAMSRINSIEGLRDTLEQLVFTQRVPVLGVCLGMQLLVDGSEEGSETGLGWIPGKAVRLPGDQALKVPQMGWNVARPTNPSVLTDAVGDQPRYYFVHSYCVHVDRPEHSLMRTHYGVSFDSAIGRGNIFGVQFHPEKSHRYGMHILKNFATL